MMGGDIIPNDMDDGRPSFDICLEYFRCTLVAAAKASSTNWASRSELIQLHLTRLVMTINDRTFISKVSQWDNSSE